MKNKKKKGSEQCFSTVLMRQSNLSEGTEDGSGGDNLTTLNPGSSERPRTNTFRKTRNVTVKLLMFKKIKQS